MSAGEVRGQRCDSFPVLALGQRGRKGTLRSGKSPVQRQCKLLD